MPALYHSRSNSDFRFTDLINIIITHAINYLTIECALIYFRYQRLRNLPVFHQPASAPVIKTSSARCRAPEISAKVMVADLQICQNI